MHYVIYDGVTDQILSRYDPEDEDLWEWDGYAVENAVEGAHLFLTEKEAEDAVERLSKAFANEEGGVDFEICPVQKRTAYFLL